MKNIPWPILTALVAATLLLGPTSAALQDPGVGGQGSQVTMLRLRDGATHWGTIREHDPDGMRFVLLSSGGVVGVSWSLLDPAQELALRERFGTEADGFKRLDTGGSLLFEYFIRV